VRARDYDNVFDVLYFERSALTTRRRSGVEVVCPHDGALRLDSGRGNDGIPVDDLDITHVD
jgi:hypothetical protein